MTVYSVLSQFLSCPSDLPITLCEPVSSTTKQIYDKTSPLAALSKTFDEVSSCSSAMAGSPTVKKCKSGPDSAPHVEKRSDSVPVVEPVSREEHSTSSSTPSSFSSMTITGKFGNIDYKYRIDPRVLGTGRHGSVRECIKRTHGEQRFAVKSIRKADPAVDPGDLDREIMLLLEMKHRSIVRLMDIFEDATYVHLVTELCQGGELFDRIVERSSNRCDNGAPCFTEDNASRIVRQILTAVSYMHGRDIAHRDIKPENILFETQDNESLIKVVDFGLAREHRRSSTGEILPMTTVVGTPYYMAPEVLRKNYDKSCDLWSIGVITYILLCGYPPFNGANDAEVYDSIRRGRCRFPAKERSGTSGGSRDFVCHLLKKDPRKRMTAGRALDHPWITRKISTMRFC